METLLLDNQPLSIYGSTEMTSQDNLRGRLSDVIDRALSAWLTVDNALDGTVEGSEEDFVAQAIIDEFGLHYVDSEEYAQVGLDWIEVEKGRHVVGKWEAEQ